MFPFGKKDVNEQETNVIMETWNYLLNGCVFEQKKKNYIQISVRK